MFLLKLNVGGTYFNIHFQYSCKLRASVPHARNQKKFFDKRGTADGTDTAEKQPKKSKKDKSDKKKKQEKAQCADQPAHKRQKKGKNA